MRRSVLMAAGGALALLAGVASASAQDAPAGNAVAGRKLARTICQTCHGLDGIAKQPDAANLAGQDASYLDRQLAAFHNGERKNETMAAVAQMLSPQQMADVAAYYNSVKITATVPPAP